MRLGLLGLGAVCVFFTAQELFPGRMSALSLFSEVFEKLQNHEEVMVMTGHNMKAFGRDVGRNTEGRRNHVDSYSYTAEDGSKRLRIRMNIKGEKGKVIVWAEVRNIVFMCLCMVLMKMRALWVRTCQPMYVVATAPRARTEISLLTCFLSVPHDRCLTAWRPTSTCTSSARTRRRARS
jgi:hypothetical protein